MAQIHRGRIETHLSIKKSAILILMVLCGGCGSSGPDGGVSGSSPSSLSADQVNRTRNPTSSTISRVTMPLNIVEHGGGKVTADEQVADRSLRSEPSIPQSIENDLRSPAARNRYRALDYWEGKDNKASLDPVFEAMEDEDPAVRAKATAIVEQYWAAEQQRENGQHN